MPGEGLLLDSFEAYATAQLNSTSTSSVSVTFTDVQSIQASDMLVTNEGTTTAYVASGNGSATAAIPTSSPAYGTTPILAGATIVLKKGAGNNVVAAIPASGSLKIDITAGVGS